MLSETGIQSWLALARVRTINVMRLHHIIQQFEKVEWIFTESQSSLLEKGLSLKEINILKTVNTKQIEKDQKWLDQPNCHLVTFYDANYPKWLKEISDPPVALFVKGNKTILAEPQIAIVGSRNPTTYGAKLAFDFGKSLAEVGLVITSGLAIGIDGESHKGALAENRPTIAVMGCGLESIYPPQHKLLAQQIVEQGAIVSDFPPDVPPIARNFPLRNRIISGMSLGTLVIEAAIKSGSLITARLAAEQGRDVFAVPGSIFNQKAKGCHYLIRQGAKLVEGPEDLLEEIKLDFFSLRPLTPQKDPKKKITITKKEQEFLRHIGYHPTPLDFIIQQSGLTAREVSSMLLVLELRGYVELVPGGYARPAQ